MLFDLQWKGPVVLVSFSEGQLLKGCHFSYHLLCMSWIAQLLPLRFGSRSLYASRIHSSSGGFCLLALHLLLSARISSLPPLEGRLLFHVEPSLFSRTCLSLLIVAVRGFGLILTTSTFSWGLMRGSVEPVHLSGRR